MILWIILLIGAGIKPAPASLDSIPKIVYLQEKSPRKALLLSILPGGGQFYTQNYLKGAVFCAVQTTLAGATIYEYILANRAKKEGDDFSYKYFSDWLKNFYWMNGIVWTISMADAYVSAHFYKFKQQGTLEIGFRF